MTEDRNTGRLIGVALIAQGVLGGLTNFVWMIVPMGLSHLLLAVWLMVRGFELRPVTPAGTMHATG